jgi:Fe-Mn family superoxide dismutase
MSFIFPQLPFPDNALEPYMSAKTLQVHHGKHHKAYVEALNTLIAGTAYERMTLEEIITQTHPANEKDFGKIFNNAAQAWNHTFFWNCLKVDATAPAGLLNTAIENAFGNLDEFKAKFVAAGKEQFGSGWVWLVWCPNHQALEIAKTGNADTPLAHGKVPLLTCDVWEHAYYLDYQNRRADFLQTFVDRLINWDFAAEGFARVTRKMAA